MTYDPNKHHRRSIRLKGYDYTQPGAYFITICTQNRECLFGDVVDGEMRLDACGVIVREEWFRSAEIRREIALWPDEFVVMPNHIHGIVWITDQRDVAGPNVGAHGRAPLPGYQAVRPDRIAVRGHWHRLSPGSNPSPPNALTNIAARPAHPCGNAIITNASSAMMWRCTTSGNTSSTTPPAGPWIRRTRRNAAYECLQ